VEGSDEEEENDQNFNADTKKDEEKGFRTSSEEGEKVKNGCPSGAKIAEANRQDKRIRKEEGKERRGGKESSSPYPAKSYAAKKENLRRCSEA